APILAAALGSGSLPVADRRTSPRLAAPRRSLVEVTLPALDPPYRGYYTRDVDPQASAALTALENDVMSAPLRRLPAVSPLAWQQAFGAVAAGLSKAGNQSASTITAQASNIAWTTNRQLIITGGDGPLPVVISIIRADLPPPNPGRGPYRLRH